MKQYMNFTGAILQVKIVCSRKLNDFRFIDGLKFLTYVVRTASTLKNFCCRPVIKTNDRANNFP